MPCDQSGGDRGEAICQDNDDRRLFWQFLGEVCERTGWLIHAFHVEERIGGAGNRRNGFGGPSERFGGKISIGLVVEEKDGGGPGMGT